MNRVTADDQLDAETDATAFRLTRLGCDVLARTKSYVDQLTVPPERHFSPARADFSQVLARPAVQARSARLEALGLNTNSDPSARRRGVASRCLSVDGPISTEVRRNQ